MALPSRPLRLLVTALIALVCAALLWAVIGVLRSGVALWQELRAQPPWLQLGIAVLLGALLLGIAWAAWKLLRPRKRRAAAAAPTRSAVEQRVAELREAHFDTAALQQELEELDRRARGEELYVAVFGEISAGKSSLIRAFVPHAQAETDVLGGTTRHV